MIARGACAVHGRRCGREEPGGTVRAHVETPGAPTHSRNIGDDPPYASPIVGFLAKYGDAWRFEVRGDMFVHGGGEAAVFRIDAAKTLAFAKRPHGQTAFT